MRIVSFGPELGHQVQQHGSDFILTPLMGVSDQARTVCMHLGPGQVVGEHEATTTQLFCVVSGDGWVAGPDGVRHPIAALQAAHWAAGERHASGTDTGMVAFVIEGDFSAMNGR